MLTSRKHQEHKYLLKKLLKNIEIWQERNLTREHHKILLMILLI